MATAVSPTGLLPIVLNPGTPQELNLNDGEGYVTGADLSLDPPSVKSVYASSINTEGSIPVPNSAHYENREIGFKVRCYGSSDAGVEDRIAAMAEHLGRIHRNGGVIGVTTPGGRVCYFDLVNEGSAAAEYGENWLRLNKTDVQVTLQARPFWRSQERMIGTFTRDDATVPAIIFEALVGGDVPALGRLVFRDTSGFNQWVVYVGAESTYLNTDPDALLYYRCTGQMRALGTSTDNGTDIVNTNLHNSYQAILSSTLPGDTLLNHRGSFRVLMRSNRPTSNTGQVSYQLQYGSAGRWAYEPAATFPAGDREGLLCVTDLGVVTIDSDDPWEFRLLVKSSTFGDEVQVRDFLLIPTTDRAYIRMSAKRRDEAPSSFVAIDGFNQAAGPLAGQAMDLGGNYVAGGADPDDFQVDATNDWATRNVGNDPANVLGGRAALTPASYSDIFAGINGYNDYTGAGAMTAGEHLVRGLTMRYVNTSNGLVVGTLDVYGTGAHAYAYIAKRVAGVDTVLLQEILPTTIAPSTIIQTGTNVVTWASVDSYGLITLTLALLFSNTRYTWQVWDTDCQAGGALATGQAGPYDRHSTGANSILRTYDNFFAYVPTADAAVYANQSLELAHDRARRTDPTGAVHTPVSEPSGNYLRLNPGRNRMIVSNFRHDPNLIPNPTIDSSEVDLYVTERGLIVPSA